MGCLLLFVVCGLLFAIGRYLLLFCSRVACCCYVLVDVGLCVLLVVVCGVQLVGCCLMSVLFLVVICFCGLLCVALPCFLV